MIPPYAELHCVSNFSFLRGASHPEELVERAKAQGYSALAVTDECSLAGVVRAHVKAKEVGLPLLIGAEFGLHGLFGHPDAPVAPPQRPSGGPKDPKDGRTLSTRASARDARAPPARLVLLAQDREGYGNLSALITRARMRAAKGHYRLLAEDLAAGVPGCVALLVPCPAVATHAAGDDASPGSPLDRLRQQARFVHDGFGKRAWLAAELLARGHDVPLLARLREVSRDAGLPLVAAGDVHYHLRSRRSLHDVLAATRLGRPVRELGFALAPNAEQHLRARLRLAQLYPPELMEETLEVAAHCGFSLDSLRYEYPQEIVPEGHTPASWLRHLAYEGAAVRYPSGLPDAVRAQIEHELALITDLAYEPYFLTVADIVRFARGRGILCQGRGSAANSAVCYCIGITEVDPSRMSVLFERFISRERNEPPDIDVDFEHQRREEVIQYLYGKYGRERTALTGALATYRPRSALRDVGRALGIEPQRIDLLTRNQQWWDGRSIRPERFVEAGFDPASRVVLAWMKLTTQLMGFPRHLSQHSGGFVIARDSLARLVPIENAAMPERSVIQWDKDDLDALGLLKVDVLALGMLSAIRRALDFVTRRRGVTPGDAGAFRLQDIPAEDPDTYEMISNADTVGVFQIESRAQMSMLPRLRPRCFYDLVIEVAIVRPGPIQGGMVHPYLRRRQGLEAVEYPREEIRPALERTLGVPIFQEQVMQIAILAAGFTPGEADQLRRAMAAWRRKGGLESFQQKVIEGMLARGYPLEFAERIFKQIEGFGEYGFPESHAASFALLVYVSCWIKRHEPAAFLAALLDSQPMGFYAPAQLVRDAREHGVEVRGPCLLASDWASRLEEITDAPPEVRDGVDWRPQPAVRMGFNRISGLSEDAALRLVTAREARRAAGTWPPFRDVEDLAREARLERRDLQALARADALASLAGHRIEAAWEAVAITSMPALLAEARFDEDPVALPAMSEGEATVADYASLGVPMGRHPVALLRDELDRFRVQPAAVLRGFPDGRLARASGLVTHRQRPETARGVVFVTLEDDTGTVNVIIWPDVLERWRREILGARLMTVFGTWQADTATGGQVMHLIAQRVVDHSELLGGLTSRSRDFR
ncbi:MAG: error-prone DNA polymerase [Burkholderiales bacterium]|nr:MAG: error-prone DNA polymerase [Burkholderiales bacterium]